MRIEILPSHKRETESCWICSIGGVPREDQTDPVLKEPDGDGQILAHGTGRPVCMFCAVVPRRGKNQAEALATVLNAYDKEPWGDQDIWEDVVFASDMEPEIKEVRGDKKPTIVLKGGGQVIWDGSTGTWSGS